VYCDHCGEHSPRKQSTCQHCNNIATRHWFQLMSLVTLLAAVSCNALAAIFLLPRYIDAPHPRFFYRAWWWFDSQMGLYGWVPLVAALLAWDYLVWKKARPKVKGWFTRKLLTFSLAAAAAPMLPWWIPAGQPPPQFFAVIGRSAGLPAVLAWGVVLMVAVLLCSDGESRDRLLGNGKVLSLVSAAMLTLLLTMTMLGWSLAK
jgi:hypothetical protein